MYGGFAGDVGQKSGVEGRFLAHVGRGPGAKGVAVVWVAGTKEGAGLRKDEKNIIFANTL